MQLASAESLIHESTSTPVMVDATVTAAATVAMTAR